jgi:hypothetical protein
MRPAGLAAAMVLVLAAGYSSGDSADLPDRAIPSIPREFRAPDLSCTDPLDWTNMCRSEGDAGGTSLPAWLEGLRPLVEALHSVDLPGRFHVTVEFDRIGIGCEF